MPGKDLIEYDPDADSQAHQPKPSRTERLLDALEPHFTGDAPEYGPSALVYILFRNFFAISLVVIAILAAGRFVQLIDSNFPIRELTPGQIFFDIPWRIIQDYIYNFNWVLYPLIITMIWHVYVQFAEGVPDFFRKRKAARIRKAAERADKKLELEFRIARQEREAAERKQAEVLALKAQQQEHLQQLRAYIQRRSELVAEAEKEINVEVARAKQEVFRTKDTRPDAPVLVVRKWMQEMHPKPPKWGFLRESQNMTIRRILVNGDSWLPPAPPHPPGLDPSLQNPIMLQ